MKGPFVMGSNLYIREKRYRRVGRFVRMVYVLSLWLMTALSSSIAWVYKIQMIYVCAFLNCLRISLSLSVLQCCGVCTQFCFLFLFEFFLKCYFNSFFFLTFIRFNNRFFCTFFLKKN